MVAKGHVWDRYLSFNSVLWSAEESLVRKEKGVSWVILGFIHQPEVAILVEEFSK